MGCNYLGRKYALKGCINDAQCMAVCVPPLQTNAAVLLRMLPSRLCTHACAYN